MVDMPSSNATGPPALQHMAIQALDGCFGFLKSGRTRIECLGSGWDA